MKLLPYDRFTVQTSDALAIVLRRLMAQVETAPARGWFSSATNAPYTGTLSETGFAIQRVIHYRNSFLPQIRGQFESSASGTSVHITMKLHPFVMAFLAFWYFTWFSMALPLGLTGVLAPVAALAVLGMPTAILVVFWYAFWYEARRSRRELTQILRGEGDFGPESVARRPSRATANRFKALQWGLVGLGLLSMFWAIANRQFVPNAPSETTSARTVFCSQTPTRSPDCQLSLLHTLRGHAAVSTLALSADGRTLVSGGKDKAIKVWDVQTGQLRKTLQSDSGEVLAVAIAPDGKTIVSGSADHMVRIWSLAHDRPPLLLKGHPDEVKRVGITPDGKTILSGSNDAIKRWDLATGTLQATLPNLPKSETKLGPLTLTDDSKQRFMLYSLDAQHQTALVEFSSGGLKVWDLAANQEKVSLSDDLRGFSGYVMSAYLSPDGQTVAMQSSNPFNKFETQLKLWDLKTGNVKAQGSAFFSHDTFINIPLALSRDRIFGSAHRQLKVWDLQTAELTTVLDIGWLSDLTISPDGKLLAGIAGDPESQLAEIKVWRRR